MKDKKGVTLIALVITIIVILILASIAIYSGASTIRYAKYSSLLTLLHHNYTIICKSVV